jgi:hypothetical protein
VTMKNKVINQEVSNRGVLHKKRVHAFGLRPIFCKVFLLCDIAGCTIAEAAGVLGIGPAAVALRLARARREINIRLGLPGKPIGTSAA